METQAATHGLAVGEDRALVRVAIELSEAQKRALRDALLRVFHRPLQLEIEQRPDILGGVWVRVGDTVIDGSLRGRLDALQHHLRDQCVALASSIESQDADGGAEE
jgi:F-type H+-transporting ATPase subunit delta